LTSRPRQLRHGDLVLGATPRFYLPRRRVIQAAVSFSGPAEAYSSCRHSIWTGVNFFGTSPFLPFVRR
jgi:hypothetical protein